MATTMSAPRESASGRFFLLAVDGGGDDPALIGEGECHDSAHQSAALRSDLLAGSGKGPDGKTVGKADDGADNRHKYERDQLDGSGGNLQLTGQLGGVGIDEPVAHQNGKTDPEMGHAGNGEAEQDARVLRGDPGQTADQGGIVDKSHEPGDIVSVAAAQGSFGVIHNAVDLLVAGGQIGKDKGADEHDGADDGDGKQAAPHIAVVVGQHLGGLKKDAAADDDADYHGDSREQTVSFLHSVFQWSTFFPE